MKHCGVVIPGTDEIDNRVVRCGGRYAFADQCTSSNLFLVSIALVACVSCGSIGAYDMRVFEQLTLEEQISTYESWSEEHKLPRPQLSYLSIMARSGCDAAVAVVAEVERKGSAFPPEDAVTVADFARSSGCDVEGLPKVMEWVTGVCADSGSPFLVNACAEFHRHRH